MKKLVVMIFLCTVAAGAFAQNKEYPMKDAGIVVGAMIPLDKEFSGDFTFGVTYGQFSSSGFGFRTGLQYTPTIAKLDYTVGVPLALAYRITRRDNYSRYQSAAIGSKASIETGGGLKAVLGSFLLNLNQITEFNIGVTPGYVCDETGSIHVSESGQISKERYTVNGSPFCMSLDAGMSLCYLMGKVGFKLMPAFHYVLTDTYQVHNRTIETLSGQTKDQERYVRTLFSISGALVITF